MNEKHIKLARITVHYGKTTLYEILNAGYRTKPHDLRFDKESSSIMCGFFEGEKYLGDLVFFDESHLSLDELKNRPVDLVLLEDEPQSESSFREFMGMSGKAGKKDWKLVGVFYIVAWIFAGIAAFQDDFPTEILWVLALLPILFFGFALMFWRLDCFLSHIHRKFSKSTFLLICISLFLICTCLITYLSLKLEQHELKYFGINAIIVPIFVMLIFSGFLCYRISCFFFINHNCNTQKEYTRKYLYPHLLLYVLVGLGAWAYKQNVSIIDNRFINLFITLSLIQCGIYCAMSAYAWIRRFFAIGLSESAK